jgi:malonyl-CoA decarboxylase
MVAIFNVSEKGLASRGIGESHGIMVNYLYDPEQIEANHEAFVRGAIVRFSAVDALLGSGAGLAATPTSQSETRKRRPRKR